MLYQITANGPLTTPYLHTGRSNDRDLHVIISAGGAGETLSSAQIEIQKEFEDGEYRTIPDATYVDQVAKIVSLNEDVNIRYNITGASSPNFIIEFT